MLILSKIQEHYGFKKDSEFARFLGIPPQNLAKWKSRNTFDVELVHTKCLGINPKWLLTGDGDMLLESEPNKKPSTISADGLKERYISLLESTVASLEKRIAELGKKEQAINRLKFQSQKFQTKANNFKM